MSVALLSIVSAGLWPTPEPPVSEHWHGWPVARVFPDLVAGVSPSGARVTYVLAGIAPEASCRTSFHPAAVPAGCRAGLRATYADSTQTYVATVGIAELDRAAPVLCAAGRPATVRPVAFPGGPAERFGEPQYFAGALIGSAKRYLVATAAGYADGRAYRPGDRAEPRLREAAWRLATALHRGLTR